MVIIALMIGLLIIGHFSKALFLSDSRLQDTVRAGRYCWMAKQPMIVVTLRSSSQGFEMLERPNAIWSLHTIEPTPIWPRAIPGIRSGKAIQAACHHPALRMSGACLLGELHSDLLIRASYWRVPGIASLAQFCDECLSRAVPSSKKIVERQEHFDRTLCLGSKPRSRL